MEKEMNNKWEDVHPFPQMKRESFLSLCGDWKLSLLKGEEEETVGMVKVPFAPESNLSQIERGLKDYEGWVYEKSFTLPEKFRGQRVLMHFGAVDNIAEVYVNGNFTLCHEGGYIPFTIDITEDITEGENLIAVKVWDNTDPDYCYGKQSKNRGGMWYTPISGIWQPVWLEGVCENYVEKLYITPTLESVTVKTLGGDTKKTVCIDGKEYCYEGDEFTLKIENPVLWSPENPHLYDFTLTAGDDKLESYFALRTIECKNGFMCLNGEPYYFHGVLDQGYYPGGIYTPETPEGYLKDIAKMKEMGFNTLRKHVKIEQDLFYHYCDKLGMIVFQDMVNSGEYHYITDTVLPTIGFKKSFDDKPKRKRRHHFEKALWDMADLLYNHPSVFLYTIFNEGWGQYDADRLYERMKKKDKTRVWNTTSGWFKKKKSDVDSEHVYFRRVNLKRKGERPLLLTEFGGYSYSVENHRFNLKKEYGYKKLRSGEEFMASLEKLYEKEVVPSIKKGLSGSILTQLSDVEDETNGLVTYDREVVKVSLGQMMAIKQLIDKAFKEYREVEK